MYSNIKKDLDSLSGILDEVKIYGHHFLDRLNDIPVSTTYNSSNYSLTDGGLGTKGALEAFDKQFKDLFVASSGPRYWGLVTGGTTPAAIAGDWLTSVLDHNPQNINGQGDISANLEMETISLLKDLLGLPETFQGGFVSGATMSNFTGLAVARQWAGQQLGRDIGREGVTGDIIVMGAAPHSSVIKSLSMLGLGSGNIVKLKTLEGREAVDIDDLEKQLIRFAPAPIIVNCSAGTVNTVDFDDIEKIAALKVQYNFWLHIDAAFGGFAACSPDYRHLLNGWELADSITVDCHKWMNVPYDSAVLLIRKEHSKIQVQTFQNSNAPYLGDPEENFSYLNFLPDNSRRLRALPAWFSLVAYGRTGFRWIVENSINRAMQFGSYIEQSADFELIAPVRLNVVCFGLKQLPEKNKAFLAIINQRGKVFMTPTVLFGKTCIRAAFVNFRTSEEDVRIGIQELTEVYELMSVLDTDQMSDNSLSPS